MEAEWPAERLSRKLRELNSLHLKDSHQAHLRGRESWPNQQPEQFGEECAVAAALNITPISPEDQAFKALLSSGERFNWVYC